MNRPALTAALALALAGPAFAQGTQAPTTPAPSAPFEMPRADDPPPGEARPYGLPDDEGGSLDNFFSELIGRAQPHLEGLARDMTGLMRDYQPALEEISRLIDDIGNYELPPERLPNGDIIIRRKAGAPPPPQADPNGLPPGRDRSAPAPQAEPPAASGPQIEL